MWHRFPSDTSLIFPRMGMGPIARFPMRSLCAVKKIPSLVGGQNQAPTPLPGPARASPGWRAPSGALGLTCGSHACSFLPSSASSPRQSHPHLCATSAAASARARDGSLGGGGGARLPPPALSLPRLRERPGAGRWGRTAARPRAPEEAPARPLPGLVSAQRRRGKEGAGAGQRPAARGCARARASADRAAVAAGDGARRCLGVGRGPPPRRRRDQWEARAPAPVGARGASDHSCTGAGAPPPWCWTAVPTRAAREPGCPPRPPRSIWCHQRAAGPWRALRLRCCRGGGAKPWDESVRPGCSPPQDPHCQKG